MIRGISAFAAQTNRPSRPVLFALPDGGLPTVSLRRALALARTLEAELHVLRVVFGRWPRSPASPQVDLLTITRADEYVIQSERNLREWLTEVSPTGWLPDEVCTRSGDFVSHAAARAVEIDASLIVVPPGGRHAGEVAVKLACAAQLPVLVARDATFEESIVAATDLKDPTYPVLRTAASLSRRLDAPVIALHNLSPMVLIASRGLGCAVAPDAGRSHARAREHLERAVRRLSSQTTIVVAEEVDPADAILHEAQARNADLITVGTRRRSWLERLLVSSLAARVVNGTERSVLVVPIDARGRSLAKLLA
ncbi:MAG: universal stress protein [Deltaproteobacteria bacterium]